MSKTENSNYHWLRAGDEIFPALLAAIEAAEKTIRFEIYICTDSPVAQEIRAALIRAQNRGVTVRVLIDAFGSILLSESFWSEFKNAGGEIRFFNPVSLKRFWIRNHRKLLVCDERIAFIGGFNLAPEYVGDGIQKGWADLGLKIEGALVKPLLASFDEMFLRADFEHERFLPFKKSRSKKSIGARAEQLLLSGPGRGHNPVKRALKKDLANAQKVQIVVAYFLPTWRLRRELLRVLQRGGSVQLILPGKSDVPLSRLAAHSLYERFLKAGAEIYEYQPQVLHTKLFVLDGIVYAGSSNLDSRSLRINYELMVRLENFQIADEARHIFNDCLPHCQKIDREKWRAGLNFWRRIKQRWAYLLLNQLDPYFARRQWRALRKK